MNREKLVIFDWGGVLGSNWGMNNNQIGFFKAIGVEMGINGFDEEDFIARVDRFKDIAKEYSTLTTVSDDFSDEHVSKLLETIYDLEPTYENIGNFKKSFMITTCKCDCNTELVKYAHSLKDRCLIGLLSNCAKLEKFKQDLDVQRSMFDYVLLSCDLGCRKPNMEIYNIVNVINKQILFIDDRIENLVYPSELGWKTYQYTGDNKSCIECIEEFLSNP